MKKLPLVLAVVYGTVCTSGNAQKSPSIPETIIPGDPAAEAKADAAPTARRVSGAGMCRVHFDQDGRADSVAMTRSTGSAELDEDALRSARHNWRGLPDSTASVPVKYSKAPVTKGVTIRYETSIPAYPVWAERQQTSGTCLLQVLFDTDGKASFAVVVRSSGNKALDDYTVHHAMTHWKSSGGEESVLTYPVTYLYREHPHSAPKRPNQDISTVPGVEIRQVPIF